MYGKCLAHSKHSGSVCFRYCHTRISAVCSLRPYRELCPWCWPVTKSCYCWSTAWMKTQKSWLSRVRMGGPTKDAWVSEDLLPPLTRAASRSGPGAPGPALTVNVRRERCCFTSSSQSLCRLPLVAQAAHAEIQLNQADTWVHYSPPVDLAPIHIHSVCVCVWLYHVARRMLVPDQESNLCPLQWTCRGLTTGPLGSANVLLFLTTINEVSGKIGLTPDVMQSSLLQPKPRSPSPPKRI